MATNEGKGTASGGASDDLTLANDDALAKKVNDAMNGGKDAPASTQGNLPSNVSVSATSTDNGGAHIEVDVNSSGKDQKPATDGSASEEAGKGSSKKKVKAKTETQKRAEAVADAQLQTAVTLQALPEVLKSLVASNEVMAKSVTTSNEAVTQTLGDIGVKLKSQGEKVDALSQGLGNLSSRLDRNDVNTASADKASARRASSLTKWMVGCAHVLAVILLVGLLTSHNNWNRFSEALANVKDSIQRQITADTANTNAVGANTTAINANTSAVKSNGEKLASIDGSLANINRDMALSPTAERRRRLEGVNAELLKVSTDLAKLETSKADLQVTLDGRISEAKHKLEGFETLAELKWSRDHTGLDPDTEAERRATRARLAGLETERETALADVSKQIDVLKKRQAELQQQLDELQNPKPAQVSTNDKTQQMLSEVKSGVEEAKALSAHNAVLIRQGQKDFSDEATPQKVTLPQVVSVPQKGSLPDGEPALAGILKVTKGDGTVVYGSSDVPIIYQKRKDGDGVTYYCILLADGRYAFFSENQYYVDEKVTGQVIIVN